jgi:hypothetical protein
VYAKERHEPDDDITTILLCTGPDLPTLRNDPKCARLLGVRWARDHVQPRQEATGIDMHRALRLLVVFSGLAAIALLSGSIAAADWPSRPVTIVVPFGAGGNTDMMARLAAQHLSA